MRTTLVILKSLVLSFLLASSAFAAEKVNINTADAAALDRVLIGVGPSKADAIIAYRKSHGAFHSADQLAGVKGIGLATIEKNRDRIVVGGVVSSTPGLPAKPAAKTTASTPARPVSR